MIPPAAKIHKTHYRKIKLLELKFSLSEILPVNCKFIRDSTLYLPQLKLKHLSLALITKRYNHRRKCFASPKLSFTIRTLQTGTQTELKQNNCDW